MVLKSKNSEIIKFLSILIGICNVYPDIEMVIIDLCIFSWISYRNCFHTVIADVLLDAQVFRLRIQFLSNPVSSGCLYGMVCVFEHVVFLLCFKIILA